MEGPDPSVVQETFTRVLARPRLLRLGSERVSHPWQRE